MKRIIIYLILMVYITMMSCKHTNENKEHNHNYKIEETHDHDHDYDEHNQDHDHDHDNEKEEHDHTEYEEHDHSHESSENEHKHEEHAEQTQQHEHDYKTGKVKLQAFNYIIKTSGEIKPANSSEIVLTASNAGIVRFVNNQLTEGALVNQGQAVFYISGENLVDNNINIKYNQAKSAYDKTKSDYERAEQLVKKNIVSEKEYEHLKMVYSNAKAEYELVQKSAKANGSVIATEKSYIKEYYVEEGQYVEAGERLACVISKSKLNLVAEVSQKYINDLSNIESASFLLIGESEIIDTKDLNGKLLSYGKSITADSYYIPVVFEIDYHKNLIPGSFVKIYLKSKTTENCLVIPKTALIEEQGNYFVFVQEGHDQFHKHSVKLGREDGENVVITEGIHENDVIVTEGAFHVKLANMSSALPAHSHSH